MFRWKINQQLYSFLHVLVQQLIPFSSFRLAYQVESIPDVCEDMLVFVVLFSLNRGFLRAHV